MALPDKGEDAPGLDSTYLSPSFWWFHLSVRDPRMGAASVGDIFMGMCWWPAERTGTTTEVNRPVSLLDEWSSAVWISFTCLSIAQQPPSIVAFALWLVLRFLSGWDPTQPAEDLSDWWQRVSAVKPPPRSEEGHPLVGERSWRLCVSAESGWWILASPRGLLATVTLKSICDCGHNDIYLWEVITEDAAYMWVEFPPALMTNRIICCLDIEVLIWITDKQHHAVVWLFIITDLSRNRVTRKKRKKSSVLFQDMFALKTINVHRNNILKNHGDQLEYNKLSVFLLPRPKETLLFLCRSSNSKTVLWGFIRIVMDLCPFFILQYSVFYFNNSYNEVRKSVVLI